MARVSWKDVSSSIVAWQLVLGVLPKAGDGATNFRSDELKDAVNRMVRTCSQLRGTGRFAVTAMRVGRPGALVAFEVQADLDALGRLVTLARPSRSGPWEFEMHAGAIKALEQVGGLKDGSGVGRRARERARAMEEFQTKLRW